MFVLILALLMLVGVPLFALLGASTLAFHLDQPQGTWASAALDVVGGNFSDSPSLLAVPLLAFTGCMITEAGAARRLASVEQAWLGWLPNRLAFDRPSERPAFAAPFPSLLGLLLYACGSYLLLDTVLFAGIVPALLLIVGGALASVIGSARSDASSAALRQRFSWKHAVGALWIARWELALPASMIAALAFGLLRLREAAELGALVALVVRVFVQREVRLFRDLPRIAIRAITWTGVLSLLFATALGFDAWAQQSELMNGLLAWLTDHDTPQLTFLLLACALVALTTALVDMYSALLALAPLLWPAVDHYGVDRYQLAIIVLLAVQLGRLPIVQPGADASAPKAPLRGQLRWGAVLVAVLLLAIRVPQLTTLVAYRMHVPGN